MSNRFIPVKIVKSEEPWSEWVLEDGTVVRGRMVVKQVRLEIDANRKPVKNEDGSLSYQWDVEFNSGAHEAVDAPIRHNMNKSLN